MAGLVKMAMDRYENILDSISGKFFPKNISYFTLKSLLILHEANTSIMFSVSTNIVRLFETIFTC